jgi:type I restriction enzyme S subunit
MTGWPLVPLREIVQSLERPQVPIAGKMYRQVGVKWWGEGAYERVAVDGAETRYARLFEIRTGDLVINKIWTRHGSVAVVPEHLDGCFVSNEFPTFVPLKAKIESRWLHWITKTRWFWNKCASLSQGTSGKDRIRPERFLSITVPLPSIEEQRRIVKQIDFVTNRLESVESLRLETDKAIRRLLLSAYQKATNGAKRLPLAQIAPLRRRPVKIDDAISYPELGVRSFGKGTFHKPALEGVLVGTKKLFRIEEGDLLFNIVFAWEGAVAVASKDDHGRFGSHRFLTCVTDPELALPEFLCFHFLTEMGLDQLGQASPGGAGRNRTLGVDKVAKIAVPVPDLEKQLSFMMLLKQFDAQKTLAGQINDEMLALEHSLLNQAFSIEDFTANASAK